MNATSPSTISVATLRRLLKPLVVAGLLIGAVPAAHAETLNGIVLRINDRIATLHEYRTRYDNSLREIQLRDMATEERQRMVEGLPELVYRDLYENLLVLSRGDQIGVRVTEREVDETIIDLCRERGIEDSEACRQAVARQGLSVEDLRAQIRNQLMIRQVMGMEVYGSIQLEEDDLRLFYRDNPDLFRIPEQRRLREIVVLESSDLSEADRLALADRIRADLVAGNDPTELTEETSVAGTTSGLIDLDWTPVGDLDPSLEAALEGLDPGDISEPVAARGGLHILIFEERREATVRPFDEVKERIYAQEQQRRFNEELPRYIKSLEEKSHIVADPPPEAANFKRVYDDFDTPDALDAFRRSLDDTSASAGGEG